MIKMCAAIALKSNVVMGKPYKKKKNLLSHNTKTLL